MRDVLTVLKRIFLYYPLNYITVTLLRIFGFAGLGVLSSVIIKRFFDEISDQTFSFNSLYFITAMLIVIPLVQALNYYLDLSLSYGWVEIIRAYFRRNILREIFKRPGGQPLPIQQGQLMNVMRSDVSVHEGLLSDFSYLVAYALFSIGGFIILASIDWLITIILFTPLLLTVVIIRWLERRIMVYFKQEQQTTDRVLGVVSDIFNYSQAIKINNAEQSFLKRMSLLGEERARASKRNAVFMTTLTSIYDNIVNIGTALLLLLITGKISNGMFSLGSFTIFIFFLGYISHLTRLFGTLLARFKSSTVSLERIQSVIGEGHVDKLTQKDSLHLQFEPPGIEKPAVKSPMEKLEIQDLCYKYPNSEEGIHDISFALPRGSFTVIIGKMGAGKTTLLRVILGLLPKTSGEVRRNGISIDMDREGLVPPLAAYTPQVPYLFSESIKDNIMLGYPDESRLASAIHHSVLDGDYLPQLENGLETLLGTKGITLSGGQLQRVAAARMLAREAELLVFDDISSALDVNTEVLLWERLHDYSKRTGTTMLVVTQKKYALKYADHILVLDKGKIRTQGTLQQLLDEGGNEEIIEMTKSKEQVC
jgi:ATP-binding cassette, subfamily B, bacterial